MTSLPGRTFLEQTRYCNLGRSAQQEGASPPPVEQPFSGADLIELPPPGQCDLPPVDLKTLIAQRTSVREYSTEPLDLFRADNQVHTGFFCLRGDVTLPKHHDTDFRAGPVG